MSSNFDRIIILADESANWTIAGLRQLDRVVLALDEFAKSTTPESKIDIILLWHREISPERRSLPKNSRVTRCRFVERFDPSPGEERVLSTRLLVKRNSLKEFLRGSAPLDPDERFVNESA